MNKEQMTLGDFKRVVHDPQVRALREKNWELRASLQAAEAEVRQLREREQNLRGELRRSDLRVRRLTKGLRELLDAFPMADPYGSLWEDYRKAQDKARALLSASPSDGGGAK